MTRQRETIAEDYITQPPPIEEILPGVSADDIEVVREIRTPEMENELFMQEIVTIEVAESTDENATPAVEVSVNGRRVIIPRGVHVPVKRMYVERLARAKKTTFAQNLDPRLGEGMNRLHRHRALDYPFSVIHDPNPRGAAWLKEILAEPG